MDFQPQPAFCVSPVGQADAPAAWFCVRSKPKHERIAASALREQHQLEVFVPRIRFRRSTSKGPVWVTEALFPNYLFARFDWGHSLRAVHHALGVSCVVHFGNHWPTIPDEIVQSLRDVWGNQELRVLSEEVAPGDQVSIVGGTFHGLEGVITQILPSRQRVAVLMDFLGRQTTFEVDANAVVRSGPERELPL